MDRRLPHREMEEPILRLAAVVGIEEPRPSLQRHREPGALKSSGSTKYTLSEIWPRILRPRSLTVAAPIGAARVSKRTPDTLPNF